LKSATTEITQLIVPPEKELTFPQIIKSQTAFNWRPSVSTVFLPVMLGGGGDITEKDIHINRGS
jgi:hypothetical protein